VLDKVVCLGTEIAPEEEAELFVFLDKNFDVFAWSASDLIGVSRDIIKHRLQVNPAAKPRKQKLYKISKEKVEVVKAEVQSLLDAAFIRKVTYPWLWLRLNYFHHTHLLCGCNLRLLYNSLPEVIDSPLPRSRSEGFSDRL
jgi:hypothetical protein